MNYNRKSFERYAREYDGSTFYLDNSSDSMIVDRIEEMASEIERSERIYNEYSGTYDTECTATWINSKDDYIKSFSYTVCVPMENICNPIYDIDEDGNIFQLGWEDPNE